MSIINAIRDLKHAMESEGVSLTAIEVQTVGDVAGLASAAMKELPEGALIAGSDRRARQIAGVNINIQAE